MKKILVSFLSFMVILGVCLGISQMIEQKKVKAESVASQNFEMQDGASFRSYWSIPNCGITYMATMPNGNSNVSKVKLFVAPYDYVESIRGSSTEAIDYVTEFTQAGKQFLDIEPAKVADSTKTYFTGGVKNISVGQESRKWFGIYYYNDGSKNIYAQMPNGEMGQARSIAYLSSGYYNSGECTSENDKYMTSFYMDRAIKTAVSKSDNNIDTSTINYFDGEGKNTSIVSGQVSGTLFDDYLTLSDIEIEIDGVDNPVNVGKRLNFAVGYNANNYVENVGSNTSMYVNTKQVATNQVVSGKIGKDTTNDIKVNIDKYDLSKATMVSGENITFTGTLSTKNNQLIDSYNSTNVTPQGIMLTIPKNGKVLKAKTLSYQQVLDFGGSFNFTTTSPNAKWADDGDFKDLTNADTQISLNLTTTLSGDSFISSLVSNGNVATKKSFDLAIEYEYNNGTTAVNGVAYKMYYGQLCPTHKSPYLNGYSYDSSVIGGEKIIGNSTITVKYTPRTYKVTINQSTGGTITVKNGNTTISNGASIAYGTVLTLSNSPSSGYGLAYYTKNGTSVNSQNQFTLTNSVTFGAVFKHQNTAYFRNSGDTASIGASYSHGNVNDNLTYFATTDNGAGYINSNKFYFEAELKVNACLTNEGKVEYNKLGLIFTNDKVGTYGMYVGLDIPTDYELGTRNSVTTSPIVNSCWKWSALSEKDRIVKNLIVPNLPNYTETSVKLGVYKSGGTYNVFVNGKYLFSDTNTSSAGTNYVGIRGWGVSYNVLSANYYNGLPYTFGSYSFDELENGIVNTSYGKAAYIGGNFTDGIAILSAKRQGTNVYDSTLAGANNGYINTDYFAISRNYITIGTGLTNQWYGTQAVTLEFSNGTTKTITISSDNYFSSNFDETNVYVDYGGNENKFICQDTGMDSIEVNVATGSPSLKYSAANVIQSHALDPDKFSNGVLTIGNYHNNNYNWWKYGYEGQTELLNFPTSGSIIISFTYSAFNSTNFVFNYWGPNNENANRPKVELNANNGNHVIQYDNNGNKIGDWYIGSWSGVVNLSDFKGCLFRTTSKGDYVANKYLYIDNFVIAPAPNVTENFNSTTNYLTKNHENITYGYTTSITLPGKFATTEVTSLTRKGFGDWDTTSYDNNYNASAETLNKNYVTVSSTGITISQELIDQVYGTQTYKLVLANGDAVSFSLTSNMVYYTNYDETTTIKGQHYAFEGGNNAFSQTNAKVEFATDSVYGRVGKYTSLELVDNGVMTFRNNKVDSSSIILWWDFNYQGKGLQFFFDYYIVGSETYCVEVRMVNGESYDYATLTKGSWQTFSMELTASEIMGWRVYVKGVTGDANRNYMLFDNIGIVDKPYLTNAPTKVTYNQESVSIPGSFANGISIKTIQKFGTSIWDSTYTDSLKALKTTTNYDANSGYLDINDATISTTAITLKRGIINQCYGISTFKVTLSNGQVAYFQLESNQLYFTNFKTTNIYEEDLGNVTTTQDTNMRSLVNYNGNLWYCYTPSKAVFSHSTATNANNDNGVFTFQKTTSGTGWIWDAYSIGNKFYITFDYIITNANAGFRLEIIKGTKINQIKTSYNFTTANAMQHFYMEFNDSSIFAFRIIANIKASGNMYIDNFGFGNLT